MNTQDAACPNPQCPMQGIQGAETLGIHSKKEKRFLCRKCHKTFAATTGTMFYRRHYREGFICQVLSLLAHGCPQQAIVATFELDERTVADEALPIVSAIEHGPGGCCKNGVHGGCWF